MISHAFVDSSTDYSVVRNVHDQAFGQQQEGRLVDAMRASLSLRVSVVAEVDGRVVGHIYLSPVTVEGIARSVAGLGLAPLGVLPEFQRQGIGSLLVQHGLDECRQLEQDFVVVLGHTEYYPRFGFVPAAAKGLSCEYPVPPEDFLLLELRSGIVNGCRGLVKYGPEFAVL